MTPKILIVDDDDDMREALRLYLTIEGFSVIVARDGKEGITTVAEESPDLILTDASMPNLNGVEMTKHLRENERFRELPIIVLTGFGSGLHRQAKEAGANEVLMKPADTTLVLSKVNDLLRL